MGISKRSLDFLDHNLEELRILPSSLSQVTVCSRGDENAPLAESLCTVKIKGSGDGGDQRLFVNGLRYTHAFIGCTIGYADGIPSVPLTAKSKGADCPSTAGVAWDSSITSCRMKPR